MREHLGYARLLGHDHGDIVAHCLQRRDPEGFGHAGHHIAVRHLIHPVHITTAQEPGEEHLVPDPDPRGVLDHPHRHVAGARDHELDLVFLLQHPLGGLDEVLGAFLHRDAPEEEDDAVFRLDRRALLGLGFVLSDAVVDDIDLGIGHAVAFVHDRLGQTGHRDHAIGTVHARALDVVHLLVDVLARSIELGRVDVAHQRLAGDLLEQQPSGIGQPIVGVDDIEALREPERRDELGVSVSIAEEVAAVTAVSGTQLLDGVHD